MNKRAFLRVAMSCCTLLAPKIRRGSVKDLLKPLFLMGCFAVDFQEVKRPLRTKSGKRPIKVRKRPIKEGKRPIKAMVLVGISVGCLMGCFWAPAMAENGPSKKANSEVAEGQGESVRLVFDIQNERESGNNLLQQLGNQSCWKAHVDGQWSGAAQHAYTLSDTQSF